MDQIFIDLYIDLADNCVLFLDRLLLFTLFRTRFRFFRVYLPRFSSHIKNSRYSLSIFKMVRQLVSRDNCLPDDFVIICLPERFGST